MGDELPERLRTPEGRRVALREAKQKLERQRDGEQGLDGGEVESGEIAVEADDTGVGEVGLQFDAEVIVARVQGRDGWLLEGRRQLDEHRRCQARPVERSRAGRLLEAERRMREDLAVERQANEAYEHYRATGRDKRGRRFGCPPKPYEPPPVPAGKINTTDLDSRNVKDPAELHAGIQRPSGRQRAPDRARRRGDR